MRNPLLTTVALAAMLAGAADVHASEYFRIEVIDADTREPLPGVRLVLTNKQVYATDLNGVVAFHEPELMAREVFFTPLRDGYEHAADGFGFRGRKLTTTSGESATLELKRVGTPPPHGVTSTAQTARLQGSVPDANDYFYVTAIDEETERGVPLVELHLDGQRWVTDSAGRAALFDPELLKRKLKLDVRSHGYTLVGSPPEVEVLPNTSATVRLRRQNVAERLYRVTGSGIYADTARSAFPSPIKRPLLNADVVGQDTVMTAVLNGRIHWFWGDTNRPSYPLGLFRVSGATSKLPGFGGLDPAVGVDLEYFAGDDGFSRAMAPASEFPGNGAVWVSGMVTVGRGSHQQLFALWGRYPSLAAPVESGIARWDTTEELFRKALTFEPGHTVQPEGNAFVFATDEGDFVYHHNLVRLPATAEAMVDPAQYRAWTPLKEGTTDQVETGEDGAPRYGWKHAPPLSNAQRKAGLVPAEHALAGHLRDIETGEPIEAHDNGYLGWSSHHARFFRLITQVNGATSFLGELWYAEADTPMGPWAWARKILTHDRYTFYNPRHHPFFDQDYGRLLYFEGTYTDFFSGSKEPTPRYDYNQMMYRLDLDDWRLAMPVAVYELEEHSRRYMLAEKLPPGAELRAAFFALERPLNGTLPVFEQAGRLVLSEGDGSTQPAFYAYTATGNAPAATVPLYEYKSAVGTFLYSTNANLRSGSFTRSLHPVARVWPSPLHARFPATAFPSPLVANAGVDQRIPPEDVGPEGPIIVQLDGSSSRAVRGAEFTWYLKSAHPSEPARVVGTGTTANVVLADSEVRHGLGQALEFELVLDGPDGKAHDTVSVVFEPSAAPGFNEGPDVIDACGCQAAGTSSPAAVMVLALLLLQLRRRYRHR